MTCATEKTDTDFSESLSPHPERRRAFLRVFFAPKFGGLRKKPYLCNVINKRT